MAGLRRFDAPAIVYNLDNKLYLNITNQCTNDCYFCIRKFKRGVGSFNLKLEEEPSKIDIINHLKTALNSRHWDEIVFCGFGEPTTRLDTLLEVAKWVRRTSSITIRVNTNGQAPLLHPNRNVAKEMKDAGINRLSISLNADNEKTYNEICKPSVQDAFQTVLTFAKQSRDQGLDVEITTVAIPEIKASSIRKIARAIGVNHRIRSYFPCIW